MKKEVREYQEKYSNIPEDKVERITSMVKKLSKKQLDELERKIVLLRDIRVKKITFTIYLVPKATPRPRVGKNNIFYVKGAKLTKKSFEKVLEEVKFTNKITTPTEVFIVAYSPIPENLSMVDKVLAELGYIHNLSRPDWDNIGKTYTDMMQPKMILDDSLIYKGEVTKSYSSKPRVEVTLVYFEEHDSKYNQKKVSGWKEK